MRFVLTGSTGFLGKYLLQELRNQGQVETISRKDGSLCSVDLAISVPEIYECFDIVIHAAGLAHILSDVEISKERYYQVNLKGTENLLAALSKYLPRQFVYISSVSVYGLDSGEDITEEYTCNPSTHYAKSKFQAEKVVMKWCIQNNVDAVILRLPLIVGNNPPGNLGRMINAIRRGRFFCPNAPKARKSMVLAKDVAQLIASQNLKPGIYNLTDGYHPNVMELSSHISGLLRKTPPYKISAWLLKIIGILGDFSNIQKIDSKMVNKLLKPLTFNDDKARELLLWRPNQVLNDDFIND